MFRLVRHQSRRHARSSRKIPERRLPYPSGNRPTDRHATCATLRAAGQSRNTSVPQPGRDGLAAAVATAEHCHRMLEWKIPALYISLALSLIGAAGFAGYSYGHSTGYDLSQSRLTNITVGNQITATLPAAAANMWATLMRLNNITDVWAGCRSHDQNGGEVCDLSFWVKPPPAKANRW